MKKLASLFAIALFLSVPLAANAVTLGTGYMDLAYSTPTGGGYYLDYDGMVTLSTFGYTTGWEEVFCVSGQNLADTTFRFYSVTNEAVTGLDAVFGAGTFDRLARAAWVGDNWTTWGTDDTTKGEAQKAVWALMGVMNIMDGAGTDYAIYQAAMLQTPVANSNWYFAYSPYTPGAPNYQDYITPVPEPGILILLGIALSVVGLASRRFKF
jgi:hypothetical protein